MAHRLSSEIGEALGWPGDAFIDATLLGQHVTVVAAVHMAEHGRRSRRGVGSVVSLPLLDGVSALSSDLPTSLHGGWLVEAVDRGLVQEAGGGFVRCVGRPLSIIGVLRTVRGDWMRAVEGLSLFAPLAARAIVIPPDQPEREFLIWEAASLDIGVVDVDGAVVSPARRPVVRRSPTEWLMTEVVYERWLRTSGDVSRSGPCRGAMAVGPPA